jgi:hypothetical protein
MRRQFDNAWSSIRSTLLIFVAVYPFAVGVFSLAEEVNQNNRPDFDLVSLFGLPISMGK